MKIRSILLAGALAAAPAIAFAQQTKTTKETTTTTTTNPDQSQTETKTTTVTVTGTVQAYEAGKSITIVSSGGEATTLTIDAMSALPKDLVNGKTVTIYTANVSGVPTVRQVTYKTITKTKSY